MEDQLCSVCSWGMAVCGALSLIPFRLARGWRTWPLYLMGAGLVLFLLAGPGNSVGQAIMVSLMMFLWVNGMAKLGLMQLLTAWSGGSRRRMMALPQRRLQLVLSMPILAACALWVSSMGIGWSAVLDAYRIRPGDSIRSVQMSGAGEGASLSARKTFAAGG